MPLWVELVVLLLLTYLAEFGFGWAVWDRGN